ncbi:MAG: toprim domain-containing protein [Planctomycetes bacterium]|nr:toprim domain-containing protein [Planctomycetota bacterium]
MKPDYERIKRELSIERVLREYGMSLDLKKSGSQLYGRCPIHNGDNPRAFNVSLEKNLWNCFTHCGGGSVIDLLMAIENVGVREAAQIGNDLLGICYEEGRPAGSVLKPLRFRLTLEPDHNYQKSRNISPETAQYFGIGYCNRGIMTGRIAIPIHDVDGNLVAYCGRAVDDTQPKYRFPRGFPKNRVVYNLNHVVKDQGKEVVVVEGFFDVFALYAAGLESVALMGSSMSHHQKKQLLSLEQRLAFMFDGDEAGRRGMRQAIDALHEKRPIKAIYLPENMQPDHYGQNYLREFL